MRERALLLPLRASQRKAPAQHGRRRAGKPVFAYAGREGRSFNATRGTACGDWRPRRAALDARSEHLLPCRATAARGWACVRACCCPRHMLQTGDGDTACAMLTIMLYMQEAHIKAALRYTGDGVSAHVPPRCPARPRRTWQRRGDTAAGHMPANLGSRGTK